MIEFKRIPKKNIYDKWPQEDFSFFTGLYSYLHDARVVRVDEENMKCDITLLDFPASFIEVPLFSAGMHRKSFSGIPVREGDCVVIGFKMTMGRPEPRILSVLPIFPKYSRNLDKTYWYDKSEKREARPSLEEGVYKALSEELSFISLSDRYYRTDGDTFIVSSLPDIALQYRREGSLWVTDSGSTLYRGLPLKLAEITDKHSVLTTNNQLIIIDTPVDNETPFKDGGQPYYVFKKKVKEKWSLPEFNPLSEGFYQESNWGYDEESYFYFWSIGTLLGNDNQAVKQQLVQNDEDLTTDVNEIPVNSDEALENSQATFFSFMSRFGLNCSISKEGVVQIVVPKSSDKDGEAGESVSALLKFLGALYSYIGKDSDGLSLRIKTEGDVRLKIQDLLIEAENVTINAKNIACNADSVAVNTPSFTYNGEEVATV